MKEKHDPSDAPSSSVINDVKLLKKGMADTGGEIKKLSDDSEGAKKTLTLVSKLIKSVRKDVMKLRVSRSSFAMTEILHLDLQAYCIFRNQHRM